MTNMMETLTKEEIIATMEMVIAELNSGREHSEKEINLLNTIVKNSRKELQRRMIKEATSLEREAFEEAKNIMNEYIGGFENQMMDYRPEDEEYQSAKEMLSYTHEEFVEMFTGWTMQELTRKFKKEAKFVGNKKVAEYISNKLYTYGY